MSSKKFGTFGGVFTPSILTILGVIMYMRLPWITGNAGIYMTIGIIVIAHVISVTTGLSISTIATDKKVEGGGSYYMISRSLGLPIGGTLGLALFVGLSFSVSLYLIGFSESFLGFWGWEQTINNIRIAGTVSLLAVTTLTFISTSLAVKSQYFIMVTIALSLLSVFLGTPPQIPESPHLMPLDNAPSLMILFGIFFPAVTGFEAGVSMSGDLEDPKKSIPLGTIVAIALGLVIYVGMAIFLGFRIMPEALVNNPKILLEASLYPPLVIAGIWSATVSSAIGSILGAPRILQATSIDKITPAIFGKGHGKDNEPRNALMLTFLIAEAGILIGELDVIARIVSIFFLTTYGFLNLTCAIESWASPDFRPSFRTPRILSIIGALSCAIIMLELDLVAMVGGTVILTGVFSYLKRKEMTSVGDIWAGVWGALVRQGLFKLSKSDSQSQNWRPNLLLFSGGSQARPYLMEFGKWTIGQMGMLSDFDLVENPTAKILFPRSKQIVVSEDESIPGVFIRKQECKDIYQGIENIAQTYGFSGIDPNSILMGWGGETRNPEKFGHMIQTLTQLDYNLLFLEYNSERGFGEHKQIDVWWRGAGNNGNLSLMLVKFLLLSPEWRDTTVRFLIMTETSAMVDTIYKNMKKLLDDARLDATINIINNAIEQKPFPQILSEQSGSADLTILGMPLMNETNAGQMIKSTNNLLSSLGPTLLIHASSFFNEVATGIEWHQTSGATGQDQALALSLSQFTEHEKIELPPDPQLSQYINRLIAQIEEALKQYMEFYVLPLRKKNQELINALTEVGYAGLNRFSKQIGKGDDLRNKKIVSKIQGDILFQLLRNVSEFEDEALKHQMEFWDNGLTWWTGTIGKLIQDYPESLQVLYPEENFEPQRHDDFRLKTLKWVTRQKIRWRQIPPQANLSLKGLIHYYFQQKRGSTLLPGLQAVGLQHYKLVRELQNLCHTIRDTLGHLEKQGTGNALNGELITRHETRLEKHQEALQQINDSMFEHYQTQLLQSCGNAIQSLIHEAWIPGSSGRLKQMKKRTHEETLLAGIDDYPATWKHNQTLLLEVLKMDLFLVSFQRRMTIIIQKFEQDLLLSIENQLIDKIDVFVEDLSRKTMSPVAETSGVNVAHYDGKISIDTHELVENMINELRPALETLPESIDTISNVSLQSFQEGQFSKMEVLTIYLRELVEYFIYSDLIEPLEAYLEHAVPLLENANQNIHDTRRLILFNRGSRELQSDADSDKTLELWLEQEKTRILREKEQITLIQHELDELFEKQLKLTSDKLNPFLIIQSSRDLKRYIRQQEGKRMLSNVGEKREKLYQAFESTLVRLIYHKNESLLKAQRWQQMNHIQGELHSVRNILDTMMPGHDVLNALPFHYKQLFLGEHIPNKNFWVGRKAELRQAEKAIQRFRSGTGGVVMISGNRYSGKTGLTHMILEQYCKRVPVYQIIPPSGGSCNVSEFWNRISLATQSQGYEMMEHLPPNCVLVFHDIELWWERSPEGMAVLREISMIMEKWGNRYLILMNINQHALSFISKFWNIRDYLLELIECTPFNAEELKDLIMLRHRASGIKFQLKGTSEESLSPLKIARLFSRHFDYAHGNVGDSLRSWLTHTESVQESTLNIMDPHPRNAEILSNLTTDRQILLLQWILHKALTTERLCRIMRWNDAKIQHEIHSMKRAGLIVEPEHGVWTLNPFITSWLTHCFRDKEML
ncbi:MAG: hypothetical protein HQM12_04270 [SAR324 cluster bacterium]|nr:hypothetical protein [SAR324 cluster bacterium]